MCTLKTCYGVAYVDDLSEGNKTGKKTVSGAK